MITESTDQEAMNEADQLPVLIGVGQAMERVPEDLHQASSYVDLATRAVERSIADCKGPDIRSAIDLVAAVRTFEDSLPGSKRAFGGPRNLPGAVARRLKLRPGELIYDRLGGQSPQQLISEFANRCHRGDIGLALLFGVEVIANIKAARRAGLELNWSEPVNATCHDRGGNEALELVGEEALRHHLIAPMQIYGLMETARRVELGVSAGDYAKAMGVLFAPFSAVAASNPYAQFPFEFDEAELITPGPDNPPLVTPYTLRLVAKDGVNQAAAVLVTTAGRARDLGVPEEQWVYLQGHAEAEELPVWERPRLGYSLALEQTIHGALEMAQAKSSDIAYLDLYSCFPVVVFDAQEALGIEPGDPRPLTLTGGLPFFGGPGNNYSMHSVAALAETLRSDRGSQGLVQANGGFMSKHAVGVYGTTPPDNWRPNDNSALQETVDAQVRVPVTSDPAGAATVETWLVNFRGGEPANVVVVGRKWSDGARFLAVNDPGDKGLPEHFITNDPVGCLIEVASSPEGNRFSLS